MDGYYWAGCSEPHHNRDGIVSINAGVTLMNLEMLRDGRADIIADCLDNHWLQFVDQDAMTCLCQGRIKVLDKRYNGTKWCGCTDAECWIKHYAGIKNWYREKEAVRWYRTPWDLVLEAHEKLM
jgi:lipopolysaccharide biosynthesis glycosyltransferase